MPDIYKKLAQLIIQRIDGDKLGNKDYEQRLKDYVVQGCGGFIVFGGKRESLRRFIKELQDIADYPLFIASDIECGLARQIEEMTPFPCQMALSSAIYPDNKGLLIEMLNVIADECLYIGINMPLIPVLDVNQNPDNPIISTRAFSDDAHIVSWFVPYYADVFNSRGLIAVGKHFPGHGDTSIDSHISLPTINKTKDDLLNIDLIPFQKAIDYGFKGIMVGHLKIPCLDNQYPASLSKKIITNLLRQEMGFEGLVLTDAMNMDALKEVDNTYAMAINAGVDIILHPYSFDECMQSLCNAIDRGIIKVELIERAFEILVKAKYQQRPFVESINMKAHKDLSDDIYRRTITLVKGREDLLPVNQNDYKYLFIYDEGKKNDSSPIKGVFQHIISENDIDSINKKNVVIAIFTVVSAWHGSSSISPTGISLIKKIISNAGHTIVISFGNPYVLRFFADADILISAYEPKAMAQEFAIKALFCGQGFNKNLPVKIEYI